MCDTCDAMMLQPHAPVPGGATLEEDVDIFFTPPSSPQGDDIVLFSDIPPNEQDSQSSEWSSLNSSPIPQSYIDLSPSATPDHTLRYKRVEGGQFTFSNAGLYQRRRMKRRMLRLQSVEEVTLGVVYPDTFEPDSIAEETSEQQILPKDTNFEAEKVSPELQLLTYSARDLPIWKHYRRHFSSGDAHTMSSKRPNQLLFPPKIIVGLGLRKSH
ncbi:hypothetical protein Bpfe_000901, partial [Biomphalaria pfeifferi]